MNETTQRHVLTSGGIQFVLFDTGAIEAITHHHTNIHLLNGNSVEGQASNIFLRLKNEKGYSFTPLIGPHTPSAFGVKDHQAVYRGVFEGIRYDVRLTVLERQWFWEVILENELNETVALDVFYGQDVSLSSGGNPAYICQYLDHKAFRKDQRHILCTRQNLGTPHYLEIGSLTPSVSYSTDGFQFFGLDYRVTGIPQAMVEHTLANEVYQYEFAYLALQSKEIVLAPQQQDRVVFYGAFDEKMEGVTTEPRRFDEVVKIYETIQNQKEPIVTPDKIFLAINPHRLLSVQPLAEDRIQAMYPVRLHEERDTNGQLLSFFTPDQSHVVLKAKEQIVERPHGHLIISGQVAPRKENQLATTTYMLGMFSGHIVVGNTDMNQLMSDLRNPLNVLKLSGQRLFVKRQDGYALLGVPSSYEIGLNYSKWHYVLEDDVIEVTTIVPVHSPEVILHVKSTKPQSFLLTNEVNIQFGVKREGDLLLFTPYEHTLVGQIYPQLTYRMAVDGPYTVASDAIFFSDRKTRQPNFLVLSFDDVTSFTVTTQGALYGEMIEPTPFLFEQLKQDYLKTFREDILKGFRLTLETDVRDLVERLNAIAIWFTQNAMIHYSSPHGLEQFGGAAWGTRDVCQGPAEFFLATGHFDEVRDILLTVYSHQFIQDGDWPQWFMFDRYEHIFAHESHADIIVWPLFLLGVYLEKTEDYRILDETLPYLDREKKRKTNEREPLIDHVKRQIQTIRDRLIPGTHLPVYGGGDWNDSLQPANAELKERMVSGWTVSLMAEAIDRFARVLKTEDERFSQELAQFAEAIKADFNRYMIKDDVPTGFLLFNDKDKGDVEYILHPEDRKTGIKYRLLPMYQGILANLFLKQQAEKYVQIIDEHLRFPDGVRLMNDTVEYKGGTQTVFQRVETATNFGREIGLLYMHAHIRYMEAMAKLGKADDAWWALQVVNPIRIKDVVPNALPRQANTYFSSSDGNFKTRYEAKEQFHRLKDGTVGVKAGWRVYSSGPGLYLSILIQRLLGIDVRVHGLLIDPVLPKRFDGLTFEYTVYDKPVTFQYHVSNAVGVRNVVVNGEEVQGIRVDHPYREGGLWINRQLLDRLLKETHNHIDIYL